MRLLVYKYYMLVNVNGIYNMYMYVNMCVVELAQRGIGL